MGVMRLAAVGVLGLVGAAVTGATAQAAPPVPSDAEVRARVEALLDRMNLEEKIGQLNQTAGQPFFPGPKPADVIRKGGAGSVLWLNDTKQFNALQKIARRGEPVEDPAPLRPRRHPRVPDHLPRAARHGLVLGS